MNLEESDLYKEKLEKNTRNRRSIMLSIILCACLVAFLFILIMVLNYQDSITEKLFVNDTQVSIPQNFYKVTDDNSIYVNIKELGTLLGYTYTKGEYNKFNEDEESCYLQNDFEIVSMSVNLDKYKKYIDVIGEPTIAEIKVSMKNENGYNETFKLEKPIQFIDGQIYVSINDASNMLNVSVDWQDYRFKFYSLDYLVTYAQKVLGQLQITEMSGYYENLKSVLYGYVIVGNGAESTENKKYGAISLADGKEVISIKYDDVKFVQNVREFYVTVSNGTMGILAEDGSTVIPPSEFEDISLLDDENQLYLVKKDSEYGVVNKNGKIIIHAEHDEIGLDIGDFDLEEIENPSLILGKCIPVKKDNKYGLYNINGDQVLGITYDDFGYHTTSASTTSGNEKSVLLIPPSVGINGLVINFNDLYGIYDITKESIIIPCSCSKIYAITKSGETTYYMESNGEQYNLSEFLEENNLKNVDEKGNLLEETQETSTSNVQEGGEVVNNPEETNESQNSEQQESNENVVENNNTQVESNIVPVE